MIPITYRQGDATLPWESGNRIIAHCCNDQGAWGAGFVLALSARDPRPEQEYLLWHSMSAALPPFEGGNYILSPFVDDHTWVASIIGQHGVGGVPIRYLWIYSAFMKLRVFAQLTTATIHMPRLGCGLAGGRWENMVGLIEHGLSRHDVPVFVYDLL